MRAFPLSACRLRECCRRIRLKVPAIVCAYLPPNDSMLAARIQVRECLVRFIVLMLQTQGCLENESMPALKAAAIRRPNAEIVSGWPKLSPSFPPQTTYATISRPNGHPIMNSMTIRPILTALQLGASCCLMSCMWLSPLISSRPMHVFMLPAQKRSVGRQAVDTCSHLQTSAATHIIQLLEAACNQCGPDGSAKQQYRHHTRAYHLGGG